MGVFFLLKHGVHDEITVNLCDWRRVVDGSDLCCEGFRQNVLRNIDKQHQPRTTHARGRTVHSAADATFSYSFPGPDIAGGGLGAQLT